jgi:hypothetical protein
MIVVALYASIAAAQSPTCPRADAIAAEEAIDHLKTWTDLYTAFDRFQACDDGSIGES